MHLQQLFENYQSQTYSFKIPGSSIRGESIELWPRDSIIYDDVIWKPITDAITFSNLIDNWINALISSHKHTSIQKIFIHNFLRL